jgi:hypothetical protein
MESIEGMLCPVDHHCSRTVVGVLDRQFVNQIEPGVIEVVHLSNIVNVLAVEIVL